MFFVVEHVNYTMTMEHQFIGNSGNMIEMYSDMSHTRCVNMIHKTSDSQI